MTHPASRKTWLEARKRDLTARMGRIEDALDGPFTNDLEDLAVEHDEDEVLGRLGQSSQAEVAMIDAALARVAAGTYGDCASCGVSIGEKRLDALPATPFCAKCATNHGAAS